MHTQLARACLRVLSVASVIALLGCNVEVESPDQGNDDVDGGEDKAIGTAEQAFAAFGYSSATATSGNAFQNLGTWSGNAAYIMGVTGNLRDGGNVAMYSWLGTARVFAHADSGVSVRAYGGLANPGTMITQVGYSNNSYTTTSPRVYLASTSNNRRCFLTQVINYEGGDNFASASDYIGVEKDGGSWYLHGQGKVAGYASCVQVTDYLGEAYHGIQAGSVDLGPAVDGKTCWLKGIGGILRGGVSTGVVVQYDATQSRWEMNVSTNTQGFVECSI
ncbi:hypothetical protein [Sorangium sp. So ce363]|uniref:hypothetical protein n=1 Tax=Sorangium sp. So ce363 TaxID=3133304 RepID=UPI003F643F38